MSQLLSALARHQGRRSIRNEIRASCAESAFEEAKKRELHYGEAFIKAAVRARRNGTRAGEAPAAKRVGGAESLRPMRKAVQNDLFPAGVLSIDGKGAGSIIKQRAAARGP